ncbi:MAG TPA: LysE family translocator [Xanthobacteraceae bacterium]|jgi:homoserine/homoserine lactone efflux protein|nr:LysE family translocator [Xanthobacteraceae bacterium]
MNWHLFAAFLAITAVLIVVPGPIVTLVIATGARQGIRAALVTVAGTSLGNAVLLAAIALGLGWVLQNAETLFFVLRWIGAAYLIWLGIQAWRHAGEAESAEAPRRVHFTRGFLVALSNPKTIAFFTAFLPQFVDPTLPAAPQLFVMCTVTALLAAFSDSAWAVASSMGRAWLMQPAQARLLGRMSGVVLIGGGVWLSLARRTG